MIHCDCLEGLRTLSDESIDLVITSPPYANMKTYANDDNGIHPDQYVAWFLPILHEVQRVLKPTGSFILNINDKVENRFRHPYVFDLISEIHKQTDLKMFERLFWNKMKGLANAHRFGDRVEFLFWFVKSKDFTFHLDDMRVAYADSALKRYKKPIQSRFPRSTNNTESYKEWKANPKGALPTTLMSVSSETKRISDIHIAVFPVALVEYFIKGATNENDVVLDIFAGTGTTGLACKKLNRRFIGMEKQLSYVEIARKRILES